MISTAVALWPLIVVGVKEEEKRHSPLALALALAAATKTALQYVCVHVYRF